MDFWQQTWREREQEVRGIYGPTEPPDYVTSFSWDFPHIPGACALTFPPNSDTRFEPRDHWLYLTLGLTQPLDERQVRQEREAGKKYSARGFELAIITEEHQIWAPSVLYWLMTGIISGVNLKWGDRCDFAFVRAPNGDLQPYTGDSTRPFALVFGEIRAMVFWRYLFPRSSFVTSTGNALVLVGTGITQDEWDLAKSTSTAHLLLLLCRVGVGQCTDPQRRSVLRDPKGQEEWQRIAILDAETAANQLETVRIR